MSSSDVRKGILIYRGDTLTKQLLVCLLFVLGLFLAGCEEFEGHERHERVQLTDEMQQIEVTVAQ